MKHTTTAKAVRAGLLAAAALLLAGATPAQATPGESVPANWLYLTVTKGESRSAAGRGTLLLCRPPSGHPRAAEACAQVAAVDGDLGGLQARTVFCPMIYEPVTVQARGKWNGQRVAYTETFSNACEMEARTGAVFALDG
ncbi:serine protease [Streptomyces sp. HUCO-GS316]|uniref:SSI family serine proteinase inhibitor n=1 Tax=Streptomyces sp. HUCO-GS316 TaxID=2692198 RepID=UPI00136DC026|nr:SSI family serine proteinase inhibitor [Streptomyces sp. HUCO-GS316]MXM63803.1 serine protease [Streptomyces sp. HUCO-GS316]